MSIIKNLLYKKTWISFLEEKEKYHRLTSKEKKIIKELISSKEYKFLTKNILENTYEFSVPVKKVINKINASKKRVVYNFNDIEQIWLKVLGKELRSYSNLVSPCCFSFSADGGSKKAFDKIIKDKKLNLKYGYKIDIKNYFNEVDTDIMFKVLDNNIDDKKLIDLLKKLLSNPYVMDKNYIIEEKKGIMAGVPISSFLANIYLKEMDDYFNEKNITYARYADDIIMFVHEEGLDGIVNSVSGFFEKYKLEINEKKTRIIKPNESFDFLGFNFNSGVIDLADTTVLKTKKKIKRAAKSLLRAKYKKDYSVEKVISLMIKKFNRKFFLVNQDFELNWSLWYFPVVNTSKSLKIIDVYMQEYFRFLYSGKHNKKNYKYIRYDYLKDLGYKTLVNEYYKFSSNSQK